MHRANAAGHLLVTRGVLSGPYRTAVVPANGTSEPGHCCAHADPGALEGVVPVIMESWGLRDIDLGSRDRPTALGRLASDVHGHQRPADDQLGERGRYLAVRLQVALDILHLCEIRPRPCQSKTKP